MMLIIEEGGVEQVVKNINFIFHFRVESVLYRCRVAFHLLCFVEDEDFDLLFPRASDFKHRWKCARKEG